MCFMFGACIGIKTDGKIEAIWCHKNGKRIGKLLYEYFNDATKVNSLLKMGGIVDIRTIKYVNELNSNVPSKKYWKELNGTMILPMTAYEVEEPVETLNDISEGMVGYIIYGYIFDPEENKWYLVERTNGEMKELSY